MAAPKRKVLFVCLGNICRSPIAEAVFNHTVKERGLEGKWSSDSAATGAWHIGKTPERRAIATLEGHNIAWNHRARLVTAEDFNDFDFVFGMDNNNISDLQEVQPKQSKAKLDLLGNYDPEGKKIIRDPYYDKGSEGFEEVYQQCVRCCKAFLDQHEAGS